MFAQANELIYAGALYDKNGEAKKALDNYNKSIKIYDELIKKSKKEEYFLERGIAYFLANRENDAKNEIEKLKDKDPENSLYQALLRYHKEECLEIVLDSAKIE